jgi:hypothetical protein
MIDYSAVITAILFGELFCQFKLKEKEMLPIAKLMLYIVLER